MEANNLICDCGYGVHNLISVETIIIIFRFHFICSLVRAFSTAIHRRNFSSSENPADVESLTEQVADLTEKCEELTVSGIMIQYCNGNDLYHLILCLIGFVQDKYKRSLADGENLRIRLTKQIQEAKIFGIQSFCKDLLEVADTLGHATKAVPKEEIEKNAHLKNLYDGLILTKNSLGQVFRRHGLEQINPLNQKFDPNLHEALFQKVRFSSAEAYSYPFEKLSIQSMSIIIQLQECNDVEPDTVIDVTKIGYKLHDRCIRPALVGVSRK